MRNLRHMLMAAAVAAVGAGCSHSQPKPQETPPPTQPAQTTPPPSQSGYPSPPAQQQPGYPQQPAQPPVHGQTQQPGYPQQQPGYPAQPGQAPVHQDPNALRVPKGASFNQQQAEQIALGWASQHGLMNPYVRRAEYKHGAWAVKLRGAGAQPGTENKMSVVIDNAGQVQSWALNAYGTPGWNQPD